MISTWHRQEHCKIARICLEGPITGVVREWMLSVLRNVEEQRMSGILLRIDSPGGTVGDSQEIHAALLRLRNKGCKVVASFGNISASGGVYIGVAADKIVSNPGTITGSIGVVLRGNNLAKLLERIGIRFETIKSGIYKDILSPDRALSPAERNVLQDLIDSSYNQFVAAIAQGRGLKESFVREFGDGRIFSGAQALDLGLVDALGDEETALQLLSQLADVDLNQTKTLTFSRYGSKTKQSIMNENIFSKFQQAFKIQQALSLELDWSGQALWLYRP
uniref:Signal peptide peptidase SppA (Protease IV) n=1 Tax=Paulinella chromatophora TaxID=39717 RepID=B1X5C9_PAUCH|nr:signal peptide peptidase SppA (protease IV) [Paulinella chromatophora]ACB43148.1 signal peptide peptidase SppA (protease IV) [Paulinella chromatophora]|eukprot:gb/GEZN01001823.1/.p2 GENE.gb/GEZN01001823.1/~~gb/GEZN01001823.1/.p2  ORF type:complete len:277 (-),score=-2.58 gb/GEZN01001823.1/:447-1277(-)